MKNETCIPERQVHVWPDDGDICKCGERTHADVEREAKREWTITEKLERMASNRLLRSILTTEDCHELMRNRADAHGEARLMVNADAMDRLASIDDLLTELGARDGGTREERLRELVTRTTKMRNDAQTQAHRAMNEREALARCPGRNEGGELWERLFMFYLPLCYQHPLGEPDETERLKKRVTAAARMANDAFRIAWENRT